MAIDKQHILNKIKRVAKANGGKSPGILRFKSDTGIKKSDWYPDHWLRWGDALREAGFSPNEMEIAWTPEALLEKYIALIKKLGHFPYYKIGMTNAVGRRQCELAIQLPEKCQYRSRDQDRRSERD